MKHYNFFEGTSTGCDTIIRMLNEDDKELKDEMTKNWRNHKLEELNFVGTLGALLASCLSSTSSWPDVLPNGKSKPWLPEASEWWDGNAKVIHSLQSTHKHDISGFPNIQVDTDKYCDSQLWYSIQLLTHFSAMEEVSYPFSSTAPSEPCLCLPML
ncbi:hypothetical protein SNK04_009465 [Fusarium graminearum]